LQIFARFGGESIFYKGYKKAEIKLACTFLHEAHAGYTRRVIERTARDDMDLLDSIIEELQVCIALVHSHSVILSLRTPSRYQVSLIFL
jgi:hypothetical protein